MSKTPIVWIIAVLLLVCTPQSGAVEEYEDFAPIQCLVDDEFDLDTGVDRFIGTCTIIEELDPVFREPHESQVWIRFLIWVTAQIPI